jgi:hypothetical protein
LSFSQSYGWEKIGDIGVGECDSTCERIGTDIIVDWHVTVLGVTAIAVTDSLLFVMNTHCQCITSFSLNDLSVQHSAEFGLNHYSYGQDLVVHDGLLLAAYAGGKIGVFSLDLRLKQMFMASAGLEYFSLSETGLDLYSRKSKYLIDVDSFGVYSAILTDGKHRSIDRYNREDVIIDDGDSLYVRIDDSLYLLPVAASALWSISHETLISFNSSKIVFLNFNDNHYEVYSIDR